MLARCAQTVTYLSPVGRCIDVSFLFFYEGGVLVVVASLVIVRRAQLDYDETEFSSGGSAATFS